MCQEEIYIRREGIIRTLMTGSETSRVQIMNAFLINIAWLKIGRLSYDIRDRQDNRGGRHIPLYYRTQTRDRRNTNLGVRNDVNWWGCDLKHRKFTGNIKEKPRRNPGEIPEITNQGIPLKHETSITCKTTISYASVPICVCVPLWPNLGYLDSVFLYK